ncbi:HNH endonuclease [uncultured Oxalicibacterium sp.]|uniref:HNH endonuclease n=1 Tax=uncultured Oxalicibacterium sp. TaxID=1168540 RepID=UPI0025CBA859|nr:HNH endonuclease [uncultured Oxalicibacterium sp.]
MTTLESLKPTRKQTVKEITERLGISMSSQYDWCFSDSNDGPHLLNIWYDHMIEENGEIYFIDNSAEWADQNRKTAVTVQINRANAVTSTIQTAYYKKQPVHIAILDGVRKMGSRRETSEAHQRELDDALWYPHHKGNDGRIRVIRGKPQPDDFEPTTDLFPDQSVETRPIPQPPAKLERNGVATFPRDSEVIKAVKRRAIEGRCEICGKEGFRTSNGDFYLEGHHVIPLNCGGLDDIRNVVAICADDHRRAHFGEDRHELRDRMIWDILHVHYPNETIFMELLDEKSHEITRNSSSVRMLEDNKTDS